MSVNIESAADSRFDGDMHVVIGYSHDSRRTMLAPFPLDAVDEDRNLNELSGEFQANTRLGLYVKPTDVDGIYDDIDGQIESMKRHAPEWDPAITYLEQFTESE